MCIRKAEKNKRNFVRISDRIQIEISRITYPLPERAEAKGLGKNIGGGGICFFSTSSYKPGALLNLKMHIKGWQNYKNFFSIIFDRTAKIPLSAIAEVVWCTNMLNKSGYEMGIKFLDIYEDDYQALLKYLETRE